MYASPLNNSSGEQINLIALLSKKVDCLTIRLPKLIRALLETTENAGRAEGTRSFARLVNSEER